MKYEEPIPSPFQKEHLQDFGHLGLMQDLHDLMKDASQYAFHDYKGKKYPLPKVALVVTLEKIISRAKGKYYDNKSEI